MKKNVYDGILSFKGKWREYQERVLKESDSYLEDGKIHIVAAPGAGKTTLGIELIRRTGLPCLVLSPRVVIRQQWLERIRSSFLQDETANTLFSENLKSPGLITSVTYQTLYHGMKQMKGNAEEGEETEKEEEDFQGFSLIECLKEAGVRVICLDECHHLKNEWWKALESFLSEMQGMTVIALTATPMLLLHSGSAIPESADRWTQRSRCRNWSGREVCALIRIMSGLTGRPGRKRNRSDSFRTGHMICSVSLWTI